jgi:tRNA(Arg) A34 adenosine deaminase TadA
MSTSESDLAAMRLAIDASRRALAAGDMPYGAVLASPAGEVLHVAGNNQNSARDLTGHAEMVLLREAETRLGLAALRGATVYASGEPCAMCAAAIYWSGVSRVVFAASQADIVATGGTVLPLGVRDVLAGTQPPVRVEGPLLNDEAVAVLREAGG